MEPQNYEPLIKIGEINIFSNNCDYHSENLFGSVYFQLIIIHLKEYLMIEENKKERFEAINNILIPKTNLDITIQESSPGHSPDGQISVLSKYK